ncbi:hypothetical protein [Pararcticibacter amylolyticus]|uniref:Uncharacterized protein n=1 Tax=Pararcticibacter amylolyticus TaxID=2173175 RepID=A0A2U2PCW3_9SPHI|nr:hypothetical protein [Pararcticibacter amylolyticus]PWG79227.1 hypothetical protein DDR33_18245 [Pararcticibacter amylolyticus]
MKKLFMSVVAVAIMSSAALANPGAKVIENKASETTTVKNVAAGQYNLRVTEEVEKDAQSKKVTRCKLTMNLVNSSGQVVDTHVLYWNCYGENDMFYETCSDFFRATIKRYQDYYGNPH